MFQTYEVSSFQGDVSNNEFQFDSSALISASIAKMTKRLNLIPIRLVAELVNQGCGGRYYMRPNEIRLVVS
jgi:hypothetical protein